MMDSPNPKPSTPTPALPSPLALLRKHFFTGLLVLMPLMVIAWILVNVFDVLWRLNEILPSAWQPRHLLQNQLLVSVIELGITLAATFLLALAVSVLGWASKLYLGQKLLQVLGFIIQRIPIIRSIYKGLDQFARTLNTGGGKQFSRVVYIEYPRRECWTIAFVTSAAHEPGIPDREPYLNVYVPTTPNPTSGFHLMVPESQVREARMTVEEAFKTVISLGIAQTGGPTGTAR